MYGILNIQKPTGMTSRDVVNRIQPMVRPYKVGHAGTLDPLAEGVLVVCVGMATRLVRYIQQMPKRYHAIFELGCTSDTDDIDGDVKQLDNAPIPSLEQVAERIKPLVGSIQQRPPIYSAIRIQGQRAYKLARAGKQFELQPRAVSVYGIEIISYEYPQLVLDVSCGSGTYIRALGRDLAGSLDTSAVMTTLTRTTIGDFELIDSLELGGLDADAMETQLLPLVRGVTELEKVELSADEIVQIHHGMRIDNRFRIQAQEFAGCDAEGQLMSILTQCEADRIKPLRNFHAGDMAG
jgi:tRNA pseudouridine55 synthase